jgi:hypothetical protein
MIGKRESYGASVTPLPVRPAIAVLGALAAVSPYLWLHSWQATGFSTAYVPFHVWCCVPFVALAICAKRLVPLGLLALAGTLAAVLLSQSLDAGDRALGIALPGILALAIVGLSVRWGVVALLAAAIVLGRVAHVGELDQVQTFLVIGTSIVVEALPSWCSARRSRRPSRSSCRTAGSRPSRGCRCRCRSPAWRSRASRCRSASAARCRSRGG